MIILGPPLIILVIGLFCWLVFLLAAFALPLFVGPTMAFGPSTLAPACLAAL
ncbi:hypothetical protein GGD63_004752 [Bradyrhizobium sp. cir1]|nr:hypothetical protein [Bradyrhizobium sp. cir1]